MSAQNSTHTINPMASKPSSKNKPKISEKTTPNNLMTLSPSLRSVAGLLPS
jgi:hypothetical protein